jgi:hypothetical protein
VYKILYSRRDNAILANSFGRGDGTGIGRRSTAANYRDGEAAGFENVATVIAADLAYTVEIARASASQTSSFP